MTVVPWAVTSTGAGQAPAAIPESASVQVKVTVAERGGDPAVGVGAGVIARVIVGGVVSRAGGG